jgi:hypothetical protein
MASRARLFDEFHLAERAMVEGMEMLVQAGLVCEKA